MMLDDGNLDPRLGRRTATLPERPIVPAVPRKDARRRVLDAMIAIVARRGHDRTTVGRVLREADVPEAVFSEHFHDKHDCFMRAVEELLGDAERAARACFDRPAPWPERVSSALGQLLDTLAHRPDAARVAFVEILAAGPAVQERQRRTLALFVSLMEEGRVCAQHAEPEPAPLPEQISEAVVGGIASILHRRVLQGETATLPSLHADLTYFALLPYLGAVRARRATHVRRAA